MHFSLCKATKAEIPEIIKLNRLLLDYHHHLDNYWVAGSKFTREFLKHVKENILNPDYYWLVARIEDKVVGYFYANIVKKYATVVKRAGYISDGFVLAKYRRLGICRAATSEIVRWLKRRKIKLVELRVSSINHSSLQTWRKIGFIPYAHTLRMKI